MRNASLLGLSTFFILQSLHAGTPLWTFVPLTQTSITIASNDTAQVTYKVTNQSSRTHTLNMKPIAGVVQDTSTGNCQNPFVLGFQKSCNLVLTIPGQETAASINGGPIVCQQGSSAQCYQPSQANSLSVTLFVQQFSAGRYFYNNAYYPFLATFNNNQIIYPITVSTLPADTQGSPGTICNEFSSFCSGFFSTSCVNNQCIAVGGQAVNNKLFPFIATNPNNQWIYPVDSTSNLPAQWGNQGGFLTSSACSGQTCIAGGGYDALDDQVHPMLARSTNFTTWTYVIDAVNQAVQTPGGVSFGAFVSAVCPTTNYCIAAGYYESGDYGSLLLAQSVDSGITWGYAIDYLNPPPNAFFSGLDNTKKSSFNSASCSGNFCIAAGLYFSNTNGGSYFPILAQNNGGTEWSYPIYNTSNQPAQSQGDTSANTTFKTSSCAGTLCLAAGAYYTGIGYYPFIARNTDQSLNWSYVIDMSHPIPNAQAQTNLQPSSLDNIGFNGITCANNLFCVAVGQYFNGTNYYPLLAVTSDGGNSWTYPYTLLSLPQDAAPDVNQFVGSFSYANCSRTTCNVGGTYSNGTSYFPLLIVTHDGGSSWTNTVDSNPATLPPGTGTDTTGLSGFLTGTVM